MKTTEGNNLEDLHKVKSDKRKQSFNNSAPVLMLKGLWIFAEGTAQLLMALFAIYQGHYGHFPIWGKYALSVAGVLVLVPAALLLAKFFRGVGKS